MKKKAFFILSGLLLVYVLYLVISLALLPPVRDLADRKTSVTIQVRDWHGKYHDYVVGPKNRYWTPSGRIPAEMKWAVILAEDANFYKHEGVDVKAIKNAIKYDLEKKSFARGASTITQQVAKNLFLSREKTLTRKIKEVYLALRMEQELTKGRIIELYLNVAELGPMVYGVGHGARYYFGKSAADMTPRECAILAAMLPGPRVAYNPYRNMGRVIRRSDMILRLLVQKGVLSGDEYRQALAETPNIGRLQRKVEDTIRKEEVMPNRSSATLPAAEPGASGSPVESTPDTQVPPTGADTKQETPVDVMPAQHPTDEKAPASANQ